MTQSLTSAITSSHSPSTLVNMAFVAFARPLARTMRTASETASLTESPTPTGVIEKAAIMARSLHAEAGRREVARGLLRNPVVAGQGHASLPLGDGRCVARRR